jgi:hypothetical protein
MRVRAGAEKIGGKHTLWFPQHDGVRQPWRSVLKKYVLVGRWSGRRGGRVEGDGQKVGDSLEREFTD